MNILAAIKNIFGYSIFDDLVEYGAERLDIFQPNPAISSSPTLLWIGDYSIENGALVYAYEDSIVISRKNGSKLTRIPIDKITRNDDKNEANNRPFKFGPIKIGFGDIVDQHLKRTLK